MQKKKKAKSSCTIYWNSVLTKIDNEIIRKSESHFLKSIAYDLQTK